MAGGTEVASATLRALADDPALRLRGDRPFRGERRLFARAPHLHEVDGRAAARGRVDAWAQHARHTDPAVHAAGMPTEPVAAMIVETLEQIRVETLVAWPGARSNLDALHEGWVATWQRTGALDSEAGMLVLAALQMARARISRRTMDDRVSDLIEGARFALAPEIGASLRALPRLVEDQQAFLEQARALAERVAALVEAAAPDGLVDDRGAASRGLPMLLEELDLDEEPAGTAAAHGELGPALAGYAVFTREHDLESHVEDTVRPAALDRARDEIDDLLRTSGLSVSHLARDLRTALETPAATAWRGGMEDGVLDPRALTRVVTAPGDPFIHRDRVPEPRVDTCVTVLLDFSGSMRAHAPQLAVALDVLMRALELVDASCEVLGFTTRAWAGGRALKDWRRAGRPAEPGRLNERLHLVLAQADVPRRRARRGLAGLLQGHVFREGLDGEAVEWACERLRSREGRRILVVVSDGSPMDTATHQTNDEHYLDHHLREVVAEQYRRGDVEIVGLGIGGEAGVDLSPFYDRCTEVSTADAAGVLSALVPLLRSR
ncbi:hypothetical protein ACHAAC_13095 [Aeromicrobium sp. CF4.19]|uniref:cobaltochelatase CobT-related protein n=1 Tax=Aeromicrobium sp. CF4.19 TaxID=3373082 RepID=UPI003EE5F7E3